MSKEEVASHLVVIPEEYKEIGIVIFKRLGEARVNEILKDPSPHLAKLDIRGKFNLSMFAVNVALDFLGLVKKHQFAKPARASAKAPGAKAFITFENQHLLRRGAAVTVNGVGGRIEDAPRRDRVNGQGAWENKFEYRLFGDDPSKIKVGTIDVDSVIYRR